MVWKWYTDVIANIILANTGLDGDTVGTTPFSLLYVDNTQEKKLKNWYIQEYTSGTTFEPNI